MRGDLAAMLYVGDYFTDTLHLCAAEHALLQYLLLRVWIRGPGILDIDLAPPGLGLDEWQSLQATVFPLALSARPRIAVSLARLRAACGQRLPSEDWDVVRSIVFERDKRCCAITSTPQLPNICVLAPHLAMHARPIRLRMTAMAGFDAGVGK